MMMIFSASLSSELRFFAIFWRSSWSSSALCFASEMETSSKKLMYCWTSLDLRF